MSDKLFARGTMSVAQQQVLDSLNRITTATDFGTWTAKQAPAGWWMLKLVTSDKENTLVVRKALGKAGIADFGQADLPDHSVLIRTSDVARIMPEQEVTALQTLQQYRRDAVVCAALDQIIDSFKLPITPGKFFTISDGAFVRLGLDDAEFSDKLAHRLTGMAIEADPAVLTLGNFPAIHIPRWAVDTLTDETLTAAIGTPPSNAPQSVLPDLARVPPQSGANNVSATL